MPREIRLHGEDRYSRIKLVTGIDIRAIRNARVCVVGAGALGNEVIKNLALYAPSRLSVVDRDYVELSNLGRCFLFDYKDAEMRRSKAKAVSRNVGRINPDCKIEPVHEDAAALDSGFFSQYDVVIGCVDNIRTRLHINSNCYFSEVPYIDGGIDGLYGRVQVILPPDGACYECTINSTHMARIDLGYSCTGREANVPGRQIASEPSVCGIVGSLQTLEGLRVVSGILSEGIFLFFNGNESSLKQFDLTIDAKCTNHIRTTQ
jgi:adenylyltransferase/sulfurtransferase